MSTKINGSYVEPTSVKVTLETSDRRKFFLSIKDDGLNFYSDENSAGVLLGNPIRKSADEVFAWIRDDRWSDRGKKFVERKGTRPRTTKAK